MSNEDEDTQDLQRQLIEEVGKGKIEPVGKLMDLWWDDAIAYLERRGFLGSLAEDIASEGFKRLQRGAANKSGYKTDPKYRDPFNFFIKTLKFCIGDHHRREGRRPDHGAVGLHDNVENDNRRNSNLDAKLSEEERSARAIKRLEQCPAWHTFRDKKKVLVLVVIRLVEISDVNSDSSKRTTEEPIPWDLVAEIMTKNGFEQKPGACRKMWYRALADLAKGGLVVDGVSYEARNKKDVTDG